MDVIKKQIDTIWQTVSSLRGQTPDSTFFKRKIADDLHEQLMTIRDTKQRLMKLKNGMLHVCMYTSSDVGMRQL